MAEFSLPFRSYQRTPGTITWPGVRRVVLLILLAVLIGSLILMRVQVPPIEATRPILITLRLVLAGGSLGILGALSLFQRWSYCRMVVPLMVPWVGFGMMVLLSALLHVDQHLILDGLWFLVGVPLLLFLAVPSVVGTHGIRLITWAMILGNLPYIVASLWLQPVHTNWMYRGIFFWANQMGEATMTFATGVFILLSAALTTRKSIWYLSSLVVVLLGALALIFLSSSRTNMVTFLVLALLVAARAVRVHLAQARIVIAKGVFRSLLKAGMVAVLIVGVAALTHPQDVLYIWNGIAQKFLVKVAEQNVLSSRQVFWALVLEDATFFGHGSDYFSQLVIPGAHNGLLQVLAESGIVAAGFLGCFMAGSLYYGYGYALRYRDHPDGLAPLLIIVYFWIVTMVSNTFGSLGVGITMAFYLTVGMLLSGKKPPVP
jgi:O-antigen ligase